MIIYKCFCTACEFEMKVVSASNTCRILVFHNALTIKPLWISIRIMKQNHAEKRCHLRQVTVCFESCYGVISVKQHGKVTEITGWKEANEDIEAIQWFCTSSEMAPYKQRSGSFISIWSTPEVLKTEQQTLHRQVQPTRFPQDKTKQKANWQHADQRLCHHDKRQNYTVFSLHALIRILSQAYGIPCNLPIKRQHKNCNCHFFFVTL